MVVTPRRASLLLIAAAVLAVVAAVPSLAQMSPTAPPVGPAMGTPTTTAPSNSEGTPAGGTGVLSQTQVGGGTQASPAPVATSRRANRRARRARARAARRAAQRGTGPASSSGLNGSNGNSN